MVFDHLSQPPIATNEKFGSWGELMKEASQHKNFYAKISGLGTASGNFKNRNADDIKPYIEFAWNILELTVVFAAETGRYHYSPIVIQIPGNI